MLITAAEAAEILGMTLQSVYDATSRGRLPRQAPAHVRRATTATRSKPTPWPGVSRSNVPLMMLSDRLPYETAANGRRYVRRHQLEVIAKCQGNPAAR